MGKIVATCVLALVFGFGGAAGALAAFHDQVRGPQGVSGLPGAQGSVGEAGVDGADGSPGPRGPAGKPGKPGQDATVAVPTDLGTDGCAGSSVQVVRKASLDKNQKLVLDTTKLCIVAPPSPTSTP